MRDLVIEARAKTRTDLALERGECFECRPLHR
jgi:hypothetical protein